jgi:hypothetical protein
MASLIFPNQVSNPTATYPESINLSLSSKGVVAETLGTNVDAVYFFDTTRSLAGGTNFFRLSSSDGTKLRVDNAYTGVQFAIHFKDNNLSNVFFATSATGTVYSTQTTTSNGLDSVGPDDLRLWNLNG